MVRKQCTQWTFTGYSQSPPPQNTHTHTHTVTHTNSLLPPALHLQMEQLFPPGTSLTMPQLRRAVKAVLESRAGEPPPTVSPVVVAVRVRCGAMCTGVRCMWV